MKKYLFLFVVLFSVTLKSYSQCYEYGIVQEYHGTQKKTPLSGVELSIVGAQSTVSNANGTFILKFATSKPGQSVRYNDIYKSGYVIFNKDAVGAWRISNDNRPFSIIMCKDNDFRELKKKFYGIIEKSYKEDYLRQKALVREKNNDVLMLNQELERIEAEYQKKLSNINTYVEIFSRIDRSEMDEGGRRAIQYIEEGKIKEAIDEYEKLKILQQADEQINKLKSSNEIISAGEQMRNETVDDLLELCGKMQQQISAYEIGGINYDSVKIVSIQKMISVYHQINAIGKYDYREDEGRWLVMLGNMEWNSKVMLQRFRTAAEIPSYIGLTAYADFCYYHTPYSAHYAIDACESYKKAIVLAKSYGMSQSIQDSLIYIYKTLPDFSEPIENGDSLCFSIVDSTNKVVNIVPRTNFAYNELSEVVSIPKDIVHEGTIYKIDSIVGHALDNNRKLRKLIVQENLKGNMYGCENVDTIIVGKTIITPDKDIRNFVHQIDVIPTDTIDDYKVKLQSYVGVAHLVARDVRNRYLNATLWPDYEELVSIGMLALQVLIKNKTPELLEKYNALYLITAVNWAIKHEMNIRYNWFDKVYDNIESKTDQGSHDSNIINANVRTAVYRNVYNCYKILTGEGYNLSITLNESIYKELTQGGFAIDCAINSVSKDDSVILKDMLMSNMQVERILRKHHISLSKYNMILDALKKYVSDSTLNNTLARPKKVGKTQVIASKKYAKLLSYVPIVELAAQMVYNKIGNNLVDYEELMSIGILAINDVCKKNILAQSAEYNNWYVLAIVEWAILNELRIRYGITLQNIISKEDEEKLHRKDIKQDNTRISVYQAVYMTKDIISNMDDTKLLYIKDLLEINDVISDCILQSLKSADRKLLIEVLSGANVVEMAKTNGLPLDKTYDKVINFLDKLKNELKAKGLSAY